jgi:hypothetical protein
MRDEIVASMFEMLADQFYRTTVRLQAVERVLEALGQNGALAPAPESTSLREWVDAIARRIDEDNDVEHGVADTPPHEALRRARQVIREATERHWTPDQ